jgi:hypothetical protein
VRSCVQGHMAGVRSSAQQNELDRTHVVCVCNDGVSTLEPTIVSSSTGPCLGSSAL